MDCPPPMHNPLMGGGHHNPPNTGDTNVMSQGYIDALKRERAHYVRTGQTARVALVDAELKRAGDTVKAEPEPAVETAAVQAPETAAKPRTPRRAARAT